MRVNSLLLFTFVLLQLAACDSGPTKLRLAIPYGQVDRAIAEDLATILDEDYATLLSITGPPLSDEAAIDAVESGAADIALVPNNLAFRDDIATIMTLYPTVLHIAYKQGLDASTGTTLLHGAKVYAGPEGAASRIVFSRIVDHIGIQTDAFEYVASPADDPDVIIAFVPITPGLFADYPGYRLFSLGTPDSVNSGSTIDAAVLLNPVFRPFIIPTGIYGATTPEPIGTIAVDKILVTRNELDASVVYDFINDIMRLRPALAATRPGLFHHVSGEFDASRSRFVLHAGTQDYLQRSEPSIYERYSGLAEVAVTILIATISAMIAGIRIFKMRRKNRIDRFYAATIAIRKSCAASVDQVQRQQAIVKLRQLQDEAFDLLVNEKLAADESFRIFITLSHDVLEQLADA